MNYEYMVLLNEDGVQIVRRVNEYAAEGWRVHTFDCNLHRKDQWMAVMERVAQPKPIVWEASSEPHLPPAARDASPTEDGLALAMVNHLRLLPRVWSAPSGRYETCGRTWVELARECDEFVVIDTVDIPRVQGEVKRMLAGSLETYQGSHGEVWVYHSMASGRMVGKP